MRFGANEAPDDLIPPLRRDELAVRAEANRAAHLAAQMEAARARQAQKAEAEAARELERLRRLELAQERFGRTIDAPDPEVWALLLTDGASPVTVADLLEVTEATLAAWMQAPERAEAYQDFLRRRGLLSALAALPVAQDQSRDPKCRAVEHRARTWEAEAMGRETFGKAAPESGAGLTFEGKVANALAALIAQEAGIRGLATDDRPDIIEHKP